MKICYLSDLFPPSIGGIQRFSFELSKRISKSDEVEKVVVISFNDNGERIERITPKLDFFRFNESISPIRGIKLFYELLRRRDYDIIHAMTLVPSGFFGSYFSRYFQFNKSSFITVFGLDALAGFNVWYNRFAARRTFNNVYKIISFSDSTKNEIMKKYSLQEDKFKVIYPGISTPHISFNERAMKKRYTLQEDDFVVLFVGRLYKRKGVDDLIYSMSLIEDKSIKLLIVGEGPEKRALQELVNKLNLKNRVIFTGEVAFEKVYAYYNISDVFSMPSKYLVSDGDIEGLGLVFLEAQSYGIPCIGTNSGGIPEAIDDGKSGFIVPESYPEAISEKILELKINKELHISMKKNAIEFVKTRFNWEKCIDEHVKLYQESIKRSEE